jgi:hypothetical protein
MIETSVADILALRMVGGEGLINRMKQMQTVGRGRVVTAAVLLKLM